MERSEGLFMKGEWIFEIKNTITGEERTERHYNLIPTVGKTAFAAQLSGQNTKNIGDNLYIALGSSTTTPTVGDTQLGTETLRKSASSTAFAGNIGYITAFFAAGEATGTHREFGLFGDGNTTTASATANSGIIFSHVSALINVSATETLTTSFQITFSS